VEKELELECPRCYAMVSIKHVTEDYELVECPQCGRSFEVYKGKLIALDEEE